MWPIILLFSLLSTAQVQAGQDPELERLNFFPRVPVFLAASLIQRNHQIESSPFSTSSRNLHESSQAAELEAGYRLGPALILGAGLHFEEAREGGFRHGLPERENFRAQGVSSGNVFGIWRLREQSEHRGLIDLRMSFSPDLGARTVGTNANRLSGMPAFSVIASHGFLEEAWEFRTLLGVSRQFRGELRDASDDRIYELGPTTSLWFSFSSQHGFARSWFADAALGFTYRTDQTLRGVVGELRELQSGTSSKFDLGLKKKLSGHQLLRLGYSLQRGDIFVRTNAVNFDGRWLSHAADLSLILGF
jgi:hypothetical protein